MSDTEIEIKVGVEHTDKLLEFLEKEGKFLGERQQKDEYFTPAHRDFLKVRPVKEWLRLRDADGQCSFTYKNYYYDERGKSSHCDEYEAELTSMDQSKKMFNALDFKSICLVDKVRRSWMYKDYEVSLDSVKDLGDFVEIEYKGKDENVEPKKVTADMVKFLKDLGCGKIQRDYVGYPFLLMFPDEADR
ncbi:class IV adenylate cyclase [bacterium]|nr:class IV adenylate cyclase [bacterium]|tara:strand:- start:1168 stop:1734 length:567 start_codon:yes stop_codon:yes gene_type:complete